jgi:hypothetical protein
VIGLLRWEPLWFLKRSYDECDSIEQHNLKNETITTSIRGQTSTWLIFEKLEASHRKSRILKLGAVSCQSHVHECDEDEVKAFHTVII